MSSQTRILDARGNPIARNVPQSGRRVISAHYDAAQTTDENRRHWENADALSARAANSPAVRGKLRTRARYEAANNPYCEGMARTLAYDVVGKGPQLQIKTGTPSLDSQIEQSWRKWAKAIKLPRKLRVMRRARAIDGEAFGILTTNRKLPTPALLDFRLIEAEQFSTPFPFPLNPQAVDGIVFDEYWNPDQYHLLKAHPGDDIQWAFGFEFDTLPADLVIHWFDAVRPQQYRGVPDFTSAIPLFAQLRRYTLAVLGAAETAADFTAVVYTDLPADSGDITNKDAFDPVAIERRMMMTLPAGWKMGQFKAEQPTTTYSQFKSEILNEIARCILMPYGVAAGNYSGYNYSSGRLDHQVYYNMIAIEQEDLETTVLDVLFNAWVREMRLATQLIPNGLDLFPRWLWPGLPHVDPAKEASAQDMLMRNCLTSYSDECAKQGVDPESRIKQIAEDMEMFRRNGVPIPEAWDRAVRSASQTPNQPAGDGNNAPQPDPGDGENAPQPSAGVNEE